MNKPFYKAFSEVCKSQRLLINYEYMKSVLDLRYRLMFCKTLVVFHCNQSVRQDISPSTTQAYITCICI